MPITPSAKIAAAFNDFLRHVYPHGCPARQLNDIRMAFYGGATALFGALYEGVSDDVGTEADARDNAFMDSLQAELHAFAMTCDEGPRS